MIMAFVREKPMLNNVQTLQTIRATLAAHGGLTGVDALTPQQDLYEAGLTCFSAVQVMLALEAAFDIKFPAAMHNRDSFASLDAIAACLIDVTGHRVAA